MTDNRLNWNMNNANYDNDGWVEPGTASASNHTGSPQAALHEDKTAAYKTGRAIGAIIGIGLGVLAVSLVVAGIVTVWGWIV